MLFQVPTQVRRIVCALAVAVYVLPAMLGALTLVSHGVAHLADQAQEQRRIASALGLTHGEAEAPTSGFATQPFPSSTIVHTHGGTTHAHEGAVSDLIRITGHADGDLTTDDSVVGQLATHVPGSGSVVTLVASATASPAPVQLADSGDAHTGLLLPPPRA